MVKQDNGYLPIRLPSEPEKIIVMLNEKVDRGEIPRKYRNDKEQALRIMWRVILDWVDAQMTMVEIGQRTLLQIFFADVCHIGSDKTLYQSIMDDKISGYLLEEKL